MVGRSMWMTIVCVELCPLPSVTENDAVNVPDRDGVPVMVRVAASKNSPAGRFPDTVEMTKGPPEPPVPFRVKPG